MVGRWTIHPLFFYPPNCSGTKSRCRISLQDGCSSQFFNRVICPVWFPSLLNEIPSITCTGTSETENTGVVFTWKIHRSAGKYGGGKGAYKNKALLYQSACHPFLQADFGQIFKDDENNISSISDICLVIYTVRNARHEPDAPPCKMIFFFLKRSPAVFLWAELP